MSSERDDRQAGVEQPPTGPYVEEQGRGRPKPQGGPAQGGPRSGGHQPPRRPRVGGDVRRESWRAPRLHQEA